MADKRKQPRPVLSELETVPEHDGPPPDDSPSPDASFRPRRKGPPPIPGSVSGDDVHEVVTGVHESVGRRKAPSISTMPASEEALRVFDEMSGLRTFGGEPSRAGAAPVRRPPRSVVNVARAEAMEADTAAFTELPPSNESPGFAAGGEASPTEAAYWDAWLIFDHCPCPLFRLDGEGRICTANRATWTFLGASAEELTGMRLLDTRLGRNFPDLQRELERSTETGGALQQVLAFQADEEKTVRFLLWIVPLPYDSPPVAFSGIILPYPGNLA